MLKVEELQEDKLPFYLEASLAHSDELHQIYQPKENLKFEDDHESDDGVEEKMPSLASILNRPIATSKHLQGFNNGGDDSDEYYDESDSSDSSAEDGKHFLLKKAIGIDPKAIRKYDFKSPPVNGSQYLLAVRTHNKKVPSVVTADPKLLEEKIQRKLVMDMTNSSGINKSDHEIRTCDSLSSDVESIEEKTILDVLEFPIAAKIETSNLQCLQPLEGDLHFSLMPNAEWEKTVLEDFIQLRSKVDRLRNLIEQRKVIVNFPENVKPPNTDSNLTVWQRFCFGTYLSKRFTAKNLFPQMKLKSFLEEFFSKKPVSPPDELEEPDQVILNEPPISERNLDNANVTKKPLVNRSAHLPLLSILLNIDQRSTEWLIQSHLVWLKNPGLIHSHQARWIYSLLVCVQEPLEGSVVSDIREIAKKCITIRNKFLKLIQHDTSILENVNEVDLKKYVAILSLFICIVSKYFGQRDLCDIINI